MSILKNICRENIDLHILFLPGIGWEPGLLARVLQKGLPVPSIFRCDLGQKKAGIPSLLDVDPVFSDLDLIDIGDLPERGQDRDLDLQFGKLLSP